MLRNSTRTRGPIRLAAAALLAAAASEACKSPEAHLKSADREVYAILEDRRQSLEADLGSIVVEPDPDSLRARLLSQGPSAEQLVLSLEDALKVASDNSRDYQSRKERLYLTALDLTLERWRFRVQQFGTVGALITGSGDEAQDLSLDGNYTLTKVLGSGASIVGDIGLNLFRSLTTGDSLDAVSSIGLSITQPLLRGYGERIVLEPLTQAERDVVYEVRSFERFRRTFSIDVISRYLRLVQQADIVENERENVENLNLTSQRNDALAQAGRLSDIQADQARDQEMRSRDTLLQAEQRYSGLLDDFKLFLGLPPQADIELVSDVLDVLAAAEPAAVEMDDPDRLGEYALQWRLDHMTVLDEVDDSRRKVWLAEDALRSALDISLGAQGSSDPGQPLRIDLQDIDWSAGLSADLAIDRLPQRNSYRTSLISLQAAERNAEASADGIRVELRDALREAKRTTQSWILQRNQVALNERRVESTRLNQEAGRAETRDILDALEALVDSQNQATAALIDQRLAVYALWRDLEILRLDEQGVYPDPELLAILENPQP